MNSKHAFLALSVFTLVSIAHGEREVFAPTKLAPVAEAGIIRFGDGTAAAPSMTFKSDTDTGVFKATDNTLGITTGGTERMRITAAGDVGIGATPTNRLNLTYNGVSGVASVGPNSTSGNTALTLGTSSSGTYAERMRINSAGNVGIGTTNPTALNSGKVVDVKNDSNAGTAADNMDLVVESVNRFATLGLISSDSHAAELRFGAQSNKNRGGLIYDSSNNSLAFRNNSLERMRIDSAGNVGIGTTTNLSTLTINGPIAPKGSTDVNAATYTVATTDSSLRFTTTNCTVTLPAAASFPGRILWLNTVTANSVTSNASNVIPLGSNTAGTAIFAATAGKFAMIQSNGTNWVTMMSN